MSDLTAKDIKALLLEVTSLDAPEFLRFEEDSRKSVQQLLVSTRKKLKSNRPCFNILRK